MEIQGQVGRISAKDGDLATPKLGHQGELIVGSMN